MEPTISSYILNSRTGELEFAVGGHNPPYLLSESLVKPLRFKDGMIVGVMGIAGYESQQMQLQPSDRLFLFTDGVTEAANEVLEMFGEERLEVAVRSCAAQPLPRLAGSVSKAVQKFVAGAPQADDLTMLAVRYVG